MLIRIPVPGVEHVIEFDPDKIDGIETPHEMTDGPGRREFTGRSSLILHFATPDAQPRWTQAAG